MLLSACNELDASTQTTGTSTLAHAPEKIHLIPDDYRLQDVGSLSNGNLYWIDIQLKPGSTPETTRDFVYLYVIGPDGDLVSHQIIDLGLRASDQRRPSAVIETLISSLPGPVEQDIWIRPFTVQQDGVTFGLEVREAEGDYVVDAVPGWTLMFYAPWPEGGYDT